MGLGKQRTEKQEKCSPPKKEYTIRKLRLPCVSHALEICEQEMTEMSTVSWVYLGFKTG